MDGQDCQGLHRRGDTRGLGLIVGSLAVLFKRHWGTRLLLFSSVFLLAAIYAGTAMTLGRYVNGHMSVLFVTPLLLGPIVILLWSWRQRSRAGFDSLPPNRKQPRWQFSIRALLLVILLAALWFSWRGANLRQAARESEVVAKLGGAADRTGRVSGSVTSVTLNASATDEHMKLLTELPMLRFLMIEESCISDKGFAALKGSRQLVYLEVASTTISSAKLRHLLPTHIECLNLRNCRLRDLGPTLLVLCELQNQMTVALELDLSGTKIGNEDAVHLKALRRLSALNLNDTNTDDSVLAHLGQMPRLNTLELRSTQVTDEGLSHLSKLQKLHGLNLSRTQITDAGLSSLSKLRELQTLDLSQTRVSDAGVDHLKQLSSLRSVNLSQTNVTETGPETLRAALPNAHIEADPDD